MPYYAIKDDLNRADAYVILSNSLVMSITTRGCCFIHVN